jgi:hypothetical protein
MRSGISRFSSAIFASALLFGGVLLVTTPASAADTLSPVNPHFAYDAGPFTNLNVGGVAGVGCVVPEGCDLHPFTAQIPASYYAALRQQGKIGIVRIALSWEDNANDFDLTLNDKDGNPIATSGFGNSDFERIEFAELATGSYEIEVAIFRVINASVHVDVSLRSASPTASTVLSGTGGLTLGARAAAASAAPSIDLEFSNGTVATLERSSGEPNMEAAPDGSLYVDFPLSIPNGVLLKSTDDGDTWRPLQPLHPTQAPLPLNVPIGGGDTWTTIGPDGRMCYSELNTLTSLGVGCSNDGGRTFQPNTLVVDPQTPAVDRQWMATTPRGETFIDAEFGLVTAGTSQPGIVLFKELPGTSVFTEAVHIDTGKAMKTYNMAADPSDTSSDGGTVVQAYLRSNDGADKALNPHQLMVWRSTDGGSTATTHVVANLPTTPGNNFASVDVDRQGNVYVAWSQQGLWDIFYSVARKNDLDHWSKPVRVSGDPYAATSIQPTIKVGDRGRVFVGFYGAPQIGNPDALPGGVWNAFLSWSLNGACAIDVTPCSAPTFHQTRITEHPVQNRGICLGGTGCGGDPYYGDRSMVEYLDLAVSPKTGRLYAVVTDSSRTNTGTTVTTYKQISGPSAFADDSDIRGVARIGDQVADPAGDAGWPYESPVPATVAPGADLKSVALSRPKAGVLRVKMVVADPAGFADAITAGKGQELLIGTRFATDLDVFWTGIRTTGGDPEFLVGRLVSNQDVVSYFDAYVPDDVQVAGSINEQSGTITIDLPLDKLLTTLQQPDTVTTPPKQIRGITDTAVLYAVTGFSFVSVQSSEDGFPKHLLDITPSFTYANVATSQVLPSKVTRGGGKTPAKTAKGKPALAATGVAMMPQGWLLIAAAGVVAVWTKRRRAL